MTQLYLDGYIKTERIPDALRRAKEKDLLPGVDERARREFMENFENIWKAKHGSLQSKISLSEMEYIITKMRENHADHIDEHMLDLIQAVLLNKNFEF
jgi:uncharacterized protein YeeX (DUF496 family)